MNACIVSFKKKKEFTVQGGLMNEANHADLVLLGNIYTVNPSQPWVEAIAILKGEIIYTGNKEGAEVLINNNTQVIESGEGLFLPGFYDAHIHAISGSLIEMQCSLYSAQSVEEARNLIKQYAQNHKELDVITGSGWKHNWPSLINGIVTASMIDDIVPDKPVVLRRWDGHSVWANTAAMKLANITKETIHKYSHSLIPTDSEGHPVGCFHEEAADIFVQFFKDIPLETRMKALEYGTKLFSKHGIVGWHDAIARGGSLQTYINSDATLIPKVNIAFYWDPKLDFSQIEEFKKKRNNGPNGVLRKTIKIMLDGVIESQTALLHQPYCNCLKEDGCEGTEKGPNYGLTQFGNNLDEIIKLCDKEGFQLHFHTVGDKAVTWALDALAKARKENGFNDNRHELAHLQIIQPSDIPRFKELDIIANFQPLWCESTLCSDAEIHSWIGEGRAKLQYPIKQMEDIGVKICFGSDWHVTEFIPLHGIHVAVNHRFKKEHQIWKKDEIISLENAIKYYTIGSAFTCFREKESGTLEVGKKADFILLEKNLFKIDKMDIMNVKVLKTFINGKLFFDSKDAEKT